MSENMALASTMSRLNSLERSNRQLKYCVAAMLLLGTSAFVAGMQPLPLTESTDVVRAKLFELLDESGNRIGTWGKTGPDSVAFIMQTKKAGASIVIDKDRPTLSLSDSEDRFGAALSNSGLVLHENGMWRVWLNPAPSLRFFDSSVRVADSPERRPPSRLTIGAHSLLDEHKGTETNRSAATITFFDEKGNVTHNIP